MMKSYKILVSGCWLLVALLSGCEGEVPGEIDHTTLPQNYGILEIDFKKPPLAVPEKAISRMDLSLAYTADSVYRQEFFQKANVSDQKRVYQFNLPSGTYWYQAVITCTCGGDTCLWGGFPGGQFGQRFTLEEVKVVAGTKSTYQALFDI